MRIKVVEASRESGIYEMELTVVESDLDEMNHVNNMQYLRWCLKAAVSHSSHVGWTAKRYRDSGFGFIVRAHQIKYKIPALIDDEIMVRTWIGNMEKVSSDRQYRILRKSDQKKLVEAQTTWVFVNLKTLELARIPDEIHEAFRNR